MRVIPYVEHGAMVDLETTGLEDPRIVEVGVWGPRGLIYWALVNPGPHAPWEPDAMRVNGLSPDQVAHAPDWAIVEWEIRLALDARGVAWLASWTRFDQRVVASELARVGRPMWSMPWVDAEALCRAADPSLRPAEGRSRVRLTQACGWYGVSPGGHQAVPDARAAWQVVDRAIAGRCD